MPCLSYPPTKTKSRWVRDLRWDDRLDLQCNFLWHYACLTDVRDYNTNNLFHDLVYSDRYKLVPKNIKIMESINIIIAVIFFVQFSINQTNYDVFFDRCR